MAMLRSSVRSISIRVSLLGRLMDDDFLVVKIMSSFIINDTRHDTQKNPRRERPRVLDQCFGVRDVYYQIVRDLGRAQRKKSKNEGNKILHSPQPREYLTFPLNSAQLLLPHGQR